MSESSTKLIKFTENLPEHLVEHIISVFLPIQLLLRNRSVSKKFKATEIRSRDLDFSGMFFMRCSQLEAVNIIVSVFNQHKGSNINRFVLVLNYIGVKNKILSWVNTCIDKGIQELVLDFSKAKKVAEIPVNFSAIKTLIVLKLRWCQFKIPKNSPKGLKLLRTLELMKIQVTEMVIDAIFSNCIHLETLELIECIMYGVLNIKAHNHKKFKSLVVYSMPDLMDIVLDAPTLECYKYDGLVSAVDFSRVDALKEAKLHYKRGNRWGYCDLFEMVHGNMGACIKEVQVFATTNIFLEAIPFRSVMGQMRQRPLCFPNLKEFQVVIRGRAFCGLYNIAEFLDQCPNLERVLIDIDDFTFEPKLNGELPIYQLDTIKEVEINGYKGHWHEVDIVRFFVSNAQFLEKLILKISRNRKIKFSEHDHARIKYIETISMKKGLIKVVEV
ncbi:unnamed protein product [Thlaspi arvense]|uniref:At1g61320/AtMIF1 LRR domain-containing protein n=1 Tax=Thlaspi arvense TaxID=13288 RepID=A0AAU9RVU9_THLAR|nr:unnamed protein product [Thlaspi arvense]